jgi:hypothetical protein
MHYTCTGVDAQDGRIPWDCIDHTEVRTEIDLGIKERFMEMIMYELQKLEGPKIVL